MDKKTSPADCKVKAVMESFQRETKWEAVCEKFGISRSQLSCWRQEFQEKVPSLFADKRNPREKAMSQGYKPGESPDDLKKIMGELTVQNEIFKKVPGFLGNENRHERENWPISYAGPMALKAVREAGTRLRGWARDALLAVQTSREGQTGGSGHCRVARSR